MIVFQILTAFFLLVGSILALLAAIGVFRLPDTFLRMQASAKASTLGLACLLAGAAFQLTDVSSVIRLGSIAAFVMLTAPLSAHIVARASLHRGTQLWSGSVLNEYEYEASAAEEELPEPAADELTEPESNPLSALTSIADSTDGTTTATAAGSSSSGRQHGDS